MILPRMILLCPLVRLGMCSRSTLMVSLLIAADPAFPTISMSSSIPIAGAFLVRRSIRPRHSPSQFRVVPYTITLAVPAVLTEGTYWVSVQAHEVFTGSGQWGWTDRSVQSNSPAAWQNPGGGFGVCPTWAQKLAVCIPTAGGPDNVFRLNGTTGGGGTPTPTPTGTPAGCGTYTTATGTGTITPGDTDTGNHCDDCTTPITLPFPVSVYGTTFTSVRRI